MIKSILVPVAGTEDDKRQLRSALTVARMFAAHLDVLHVEPDPVQLAVAAASMAHDGTAMTASLLDRFEKDRQERLELAQRAYSAFVDEESLEVRERSDASGGVSVAWIQQTGYPAERVAQMGRLRDLLVVGRSPAAVGGASGTLEAALMESGRPLLIMPPDWTRPLDGTTVVAWKDVAEAARAVTAAMPFLARANRVEVVEVHEGQSTEETGVGDSAESLVANLALHRVTAKARRVLAGNRSGPDALLAAAHDSDADLVVMGAYGHSRLREMIFGGFTRRLLGAADLPVLMFH
jgi:nucleotide-binding universal stress UspA family protein